MQALGQSSSYKPFEADDIVFDPQAKKRNILCRHFDSGVQGISYAADTLKRAAAMGLACERVDSRYQLEGATLAEDNIDDERIILHTTIPSVLRYNVVQEYLGELGAALLIKTDRGNTTYGSDKSIFFGDITDVQGPAVVGWLQNYPQGQEDLEISFIHFTWVS